MKCDKTLLCASVENWQPVEKNKRVNAKTSDQKVFISKYCTCRFRCWLVQSRNWIIVSFADPANSDTVYFSSLLEPSLGCIVTTEDTCIHVSSFMVVGIQCVSFISGS